MKKFIQEFKEFASQGNVMDMAVGIIIGGAFTAIVSSLVSDVVMPVISLITGGIDYSAMKVTLGTGANAASINYGSFINAVITFLLVALVVFFLVKGVAKMKGITSKEEEEAPTTKTCPFCKEEVAIEATRCPHCTSELSE